MTTRARLDRRMRWVGIPMAAGLSIFVASFIAAELVLGPWVIQFVGVPAFLSVFVVSIVGHFCLFKCPNCRGNLAALLFAHGPRRVDPRIRFCPYCGQDMDAELPVDGDDMAARGAA